MKRTAVEQKAGHLDDDEDYDDDDDTENDEGSIAFTIEG